MRIEIIQGECSDNMSDNIYSYKVTVEITRSKDKAPTLFKGCGNYITDYRLNDLMGIRRNTRKSSNCHKW